MDITNRSFFVLGAGGITGTSITNLLKLLNNKIYVYDDNKNLKFDEFINLSNYNLKDIEEIQHLLEHYSFDYCIISPGFPRNSLIVKELEKRKIDVIAELDFSYYVLFYHLKQKPFIIAITGTDGKSTTTNLTATLLRSQNIDAIECGNYGLPLSDIAINYINKKELPSVLVIECSSYQLEKLFYFNPDISMFLNIAEDHLDRYDSMKDYLLAKLNIIPSYYKPHQILIINQSVVDLIKQYQLQDKLTQIETMIINPQDIQKEFIEIFQHKHFYWKDFPIDNYHNRMNLLFSVKAMEHYLKLKNLSFDYLNFYNTLTKYQGLPYRIQKIKQVENILFVNDSKSTTVQSLLSAIKSYENKIIYLLVGGLDKNLDFSVLKDLKIFKEKRLLIFPYGSASEKIKNQLNLNESYTNMEEAFNSATKKLKENRDPNKQYVVLLSPACASFDQFKNYKERGEFFNKLVYNFNL
jgi:UDP-N-acetylmuramoylalanine--D-glutamate ligase